MITKTLGKKKKENIYLFITEKQIREINLVEFSLRDEQDASVFAEYATNRSNACPRQEFPPESNGKNNVSYTDNDFVSFD